MESILGFLHHLFLLHIGKLSDIVPSRSIEYSDLDAISKENDSDNGQIHVSYKIEIS
jgi:hypothetical protein